MKNEFGYIRVGTAVPKIKVGNPNFNIGVIEEIIKKNKVDVIVFPELCITGYTCADLFNQGLLIKEAEIALGRLISNTKEEKAVVAVGMPVRVDNQLFNCAILFQKGRILGVVPKTFIPNYNEFYEKRWFSSSETRMSSSIILCGQKVSFSENLLFKAGNSPLCIGIDICEDLWVNISPSSYHTLYGANLILNLSASNELVTKSDYRRDIVKVQSAKCITAYAFTSAGDTESTTDVVFSGHTLIAENGTLLKETIFNSEGNFSYADVDIEKLMNDRVKFNTYMGRRDKRDYEYIDFEVEEVETTILERYVDANPFVPSNKEERDKRCKEIINLQATGLYQRLNKIGVKTAVIGISGGLDSTLALLVMVEAFKKLNSPLENIIGVTMPGFGTTGRTYNNALTIMKELGVTIKEISIKDACIQHFKDINHDINVLDITYENVQARERTQVIMDMANKFNGIVVGTGDLSELALGWCTYNGDHMSMYGVNGSVPKTLVKYLVGWYAETTLNKELSETLQDILATPVSPELLPADENDNILQVTENVIGSYELHDFFLYNMIRNGYEPKKIYFLAQIAFKDRVTDETLISTLKLFYKRFFTQQFKRSCLPDGVKVGSICLSPRGDWRMPSDASYELWLSQLDLTKNL